MYMNNHHPYKKQVLRSQCCALLLSAMSMNIPNTGNTLYRDQSHVVDLENKQQIKSNKEETQHKHRHS